MHLINPIRIYVILTFVMVLLFYERKNRKHQLLLAAVGLATVNELLTVAFRLYGLPYSFSTSVYVVFHTVLWFLIFIRVSSMATSIRSAMMVYIGFTLYNFCFLDGIRTFNSYTFIVGALLYVILFIADSVRELNRENLDYFSSPNYILIAAPVLFFTCFSFSFGFKTTLYDNVVLFDDFTVWNCISYFANITYYTMINIYLYRNKKYKNG